MRLLLWCIGVGLLAFLVGSTLMTTANPEVTFWGDVRDRRDAELEQIRTENPGDPVIIFAGGSSCAFSIRPEIIRKVTGLPAMNYGVAAGSGSKYIIEQALRRCEKGDILVLALEPHFLLEPGRGKPTRLGMSLAVADRDISLAVGGDTFEDSVTPGQFFEYLRPGARYAATYLGKALKGDLTYRYNPKDYRPCGWLETSYRVPALEAVENAHGTHISDEGRQLLKMSKQEAEKKGVTIFYSLPWIFTNKSVVNEARRSHVILLKDIAQTIPVLNDKTYGSQPNINYFSDSSYHLDANGASMRSEIVGESLLNVLHEK